MKKLLFVCTVLVCSLSLQAKTLYLNPGPNWEDSNAKFAIYYFNDSQNGWTGYLTKTGSVYQGDVPDSYSQVIFVRLNPAGDISWNSKWNQTSDLIVPSDKDMYVMTDWTNGQWAKYGEEPGGGETTDPITPVDYESAVPSQCEDIILQAFYWNSHYDNGYGDTKWSSLYQKIDEISQYFSLVWLPPSSQAAGTDSGIGYIADCYSIQSSKFGLQTYLEFLLQGFHNKGVRVLADIVINHCGNYSNACDYKQLDFGNYGNFSPTSQWMTSNDEGVSNYGCSGGSHPDDGQHEANYGAARDWDHQNSNVQNMCRAYLKWMKNVMKYDGWRYDYVGGYHVSHINDYNSASKPYFSVIEYWVGDANELKTRIDEAGKNTLAFDFAGKYSVYRDGIYNKNYSNCLNGGLRGKGYSKYAVTFVDNHDTFNRGNDGEDVANKRDGSSINDKSLMMRCNAYMLSMPGVPCVFYPHWIKYKADIQAMITARKKAGIHSESTVTEEAGNGYYRATIQGKYGSVKLMLGSAANDAAPGGYTQAVKGSDYAMYYMGNGAPGQAVEAVHADAVSQKFLQDGRLFIRCGEQVFDAQGRLVR